MKRTIRHRLLIVSLSASASACVLQSEFDAYVEQTEKLHAILLCESRNDAYADLLDSDEPDPTRRDEPTPTRHDEPSATRRDLEHCEAEFNDIVNGGNFNACKPKMVDCVENTSHGKQQCRSCYTTCLNSGTWPDATCPLP